MVRDQDYAIWKIEERPFARTDLVHDIGITTDACSGGCTNLVESKQQKSRGLLDGYLPSIVPPAIDEVQGSTKPLLCMQTEVSGQFVLPSLRRYGYLTILQL